MPSQALRLWQVDSSAKLNELVAAHGRAGGTRRGRRYTTEQLNASLVAQIAAHFQLYCRNLHTEAAQALVSEAPPAYRAILRLALTNRRGLDRGNAWAETVGADFARFDLDIWAASQARDVRTATRRVRLQQLNTWRNAIAHQDFVFSAEQQALLVGTSLTLLWAQRWRSACHGLALVFDVVVADHVGELVGTRP